MLGGFDILAAKICSFVIGLGLIMPLVLVRDKMCVAAPSVLTTRSPVCPAHYRLIFIMPLPRRCSSTIILTIIYEILLVGFWFIEHG